MLALFGLGSFAGRHRRRTVRRPPRRPGSYSLPVASCCSGWCAFALTTAYVVPIVALVLVQGALSFAVGSTLISYALYAVPSPPS